MTAAAMLIMIVVMVVMVLLLQCSQFCCQGCLAFHGFQQLGAGQFAPWSGNDGGSRIVLAQQRNRVIQFLLGDGIGTGEDNGSSSFHLVVVEFAKILHIDLHFGSIHHCDGKAQNHIIIGDFLNSRHHIRKLTDTGRFDNDSVRIVLFDHLMQCLAEVTHQAAANAAGIHFRNVDSRVLQKTAVNADLTKLIFDQNQLLTGISFLDHFLDQRGLTCAQKAGINIDLCHCHTPSV